MKKLTGLLFFLFLLRVALAADDGGAPSAADLQGTPILPQGLLRMGEDDSSAERTALSLAIDQYKTNNDVTGLEAFCDQHPSSGWTPAVLLNAATINFEAGRFSKAMAQWKKVVDLTDKIENPDAKRLGDAAISKYALMLSRLGRKSELEPLIASLNERQVSDVGFRDLQSARDGLWFMQNKPELSYRCGPVALSSILASQKKPVPGDYIESTPSTETGYSLDMIVAVARKVGMSYRVAKRDPGSTIIVPSVVHWKLGHYGAIVEQEGEKYLMVDPTFQTQHWMTRQSLDEEASGYFVVPDDGATLPEGWTVVDDEEAKTVFGKGVAGHCAPSQTKADNKKCPTCPTEKPMAQYQMFALDAGLTVGDTPVSYVPAIGPHVRLHVNYNQTEDYAAPLKICYTNFGSKWLCSWVSFLTDGGDGGTVTIQLPEGGSEQFGGYANGTYTAVDLQSTARLTRQGSAPLNYVYTRLMPDGSKLVYGNIIGDTSATRRIFMTSMIDPMGHAVTFQYTGSRLMSVTDATGLAGAQLSYNDPLDSYHVTSVKDSFHPAATFKYVKCADNMARLESITDPVQIVSAFGYDNQGRMERLTTPYGRTRFVYSPPNIPNKWTEAIDPYGAIERVESHLPGVSALSSTAPQAEFPLLTGDLFDNSDLAENNSFYWDKKAWMEGPGDYTKAHIYHWLRDLRTGIVASGLLESEKAPLEARVWYHYEGMLLPDETRAHLGKSSRPDLIAKNVEDASGNIVTQAQRYHYNTEGNLDKLIDPKGRETDVVYDTVNRTDIRFLYRVNGVSQEPLAEYQYDPAYPPHCPRYYYDAARQKTEYSYTPQGQIASIKNPLNEMTSFVYGTDVNAPNDYLRLKAIIAPVAAKRTDIGYDSAQRVNTVTNGDGYKLTYFYDDIDRVTKILYPDGPAGHPEQGTSDRFEYDRLELGTHWDREGHATVYKYNAVRNLVSTLDALDHLTQYHWCKCGSLESMTDANDHVTEWPRDTQGRIMAKIYADKKSETYTYEPLSGRLSTIVDGNSVTKTFHYNVDDTVASIDYSDTVTPKLSLSYDDPAYQRVTAATTGTGANSQVTSFTYYPTGALGALKMATENGAIPGNTDLVTYKYDALGRLNERNVGAAGNENDVIWSFDSLGRLTSYATNTIGTFSLPSYDGTSDRVKQINYPNGQASIFDYFGNDVDHRLSSITNLAMGNVPSSILSKFAYLQYSPTGQLLTLQRTLIDRPTDQLSYGYDAIYQLKSVGRIGPYPGPLGGDSSYDYDKVGNRTSEQRNFVLSGALFNSVNQMTAQTGSGKLFIAGHTNEPAKVSIQGQSVSTNSSNYFSSYIEAPPGLMTISVSATDLSPNANSTTKLWTTSTTEGASKSFQYDNNGNLLSDGTKSYGWDAENRLTKVTVGTETYEFIYDGLDRRVAEKVNGITTRRWVWSDLQIVDERDSSGATVAKRFYPFGEQWATGANAGSYYYTRDHLGSTREMTNSAASVVARYDYDPYGRMTRLSGALNSTFLYTGHFYHQGVQLMLAPYRAYDTESGRWLSRDPIGEEGGANLYGYVGNNPLNYTDPTGLIVGVDDLVVGSIILGAAATAYLSSPAGQQMLRNAGNAIANDLSAAWQAGNTLFNDHPPDAAADAPGKPCENDGYKEPKGGAGEKVKNPNGKGKGWVDANGDVWVPTGHGAGAHGGPHWDVQTPGGGYRNVYPGGRVR